MQVTSAMRRHELAFSGVKGHRPEITPCLNAIKVLEEFLISIVSNWGINNAIVGKEMDMTWYILRQIINID